LSVFSTTKNLSQTENIFGWPRTPHLSYVKWSSSSSFFFFFFPINHFSSLSFFFSHTLSLAIHSPSSAKIHHRPPLKVASHFRSSPTFVIICTSHNEKYFQLKSFSWKMISLKIFSNEKHFFSFSTLAIYFYYFI
jgi:hypothetical protein